MSFALEESREILAGTPAALRATLGGLSEAWLSVDEGPGTWTPWQALAHLTHIEERDWIGRVEMILAHGPEEVLGPVDREAGFERFAGWSVELVLDRFAELRTTNLERLTELGLTDDDMARIGRHADFGPVTLENLLATWTVHDLNHQTQIVKTLAKRYREAIGPWRAFLPVVDLS